MQTVFGSLLIKIFGTGGTQLKIYDAIEFIIRKSAHVFLFFCLGLSFAMTVKSYGVKRNIFLVTVIFCFLYAASDEFHQFFIDGRSAEIRDVMIDTIGGAAGALANVLYNKIKKPQKRL